MDKVLLAKVLAAFSALSAGVAIVLTRFVIDDTDPTTLAIFRFGIGALCLSPFLILGFKRQPIAKSDWPMVIMLGMLFFGLFTYLFNASLQYTNAAHGAVGLATMPIMTLILAWVFGRETMTKAKMYSVILAFLGVSIAVSDSLFETSGGKDLLRGDIFMLLASLTASLYSVFAKPYIGRYGGIYFTSLVMVIGVASLAMVSALTGSLSSLPPFSAIDWGVVAFLGIVGAAIQFTSYIWALGWIPPSTAGIAMTLTPISAFIIAWPVLGEPITIQALLGLVLVLSAIFLMNRQKQ